MDIARPLDSGNAADQQISGSPLARVRRIELPRIADPSAPHGGNLTFIEGGEHIPFDIRRIYYLYDVPGGAVRGGHGHKALQQVIIALSGSFSLILDDGYERQRFYLNRSYYGIYVPPMLWRELEDFSSGSVSLVLASERYDESDYYRQYADFLRAVGRA